VHHDLFGQRQDVFSSHAEAVLCGRRMLKEGSMVLVS
jgi:hypothetical protein